MDNLDFNNINNAIDLKDYLLIKGQNHNTYSHYTNIDSLLGILSNKFFHLSSLANPKVNDLQEQYAKGSYPKRQKLYEMSLSFGNSENMAMWGLYSIPFNEAIRITLPRKILNKLIQNTDEIYEVKNRGEYIRTDSLVDIKITDVAYISGLKGSMNGRILHSNKYIDIASHPGLIGISDAPILTGFVKNMAWSYENETRIIIEVDKILNNSIAIRLTDDIIQNFIITFGPWANEINKHQIKERVRNLGFHNINFKDSAFEGLVKFRDQCIYCEHTEFRRRAIL